MQAVQRECRRPTKLKSEDLTLYVTIHHALKHQSVDVYENGCERAAAFDVY
jgi:hypothetical protein